MTVLIGYDQKLGVTAKTDRQILEGVAPGIGIISPGDLKCTAGSGVTTAIAAGRCNIRGSTNVDQGIYTLWNTAATTVTHTAADATNPRIDSIYAKVIDSTEAGGATDAGQIVLVSGTATSGATLDNRTGAGSPPASSTLLADVLVPNGAASSASYTYRDRRLYASPNVVPPIKTTTLDAVAFQPAGVPMAVTNNITAALTSSNPQGAYLAYLPEKITATRIRWWYSQNATAATTNYNIGVADASGRLIVSTGAIAFTGTAAAFVPKSDSISATVFEAGMYYVVMGFAAMNASAGINFAGPVLNQGTSGPNTALTLNSGGATMPTTILGYTDFHSGSSFLGAMPLIELANG